MLRQGSSWDPQDPRDRFLGIMNDNFFFPILPESHLRCLGEVITVWTLCYFGLPDQS